MKKINFIFVLVMFLSTQLYAQKTKKEEIIKKSTFGVEVDVVPYALGGVHGSVWYGYKNFRFRGVYVKGQIDFGLSNGFEKNKIQVGAFIVDYFFKPNWNKFFISAGLEYVKGNISNKNTSNTADYDLYLFTAGGGYAWHFFKNFYLAPHVAFTLRIGGTQEVTLDGYRQNTPLFQPEGGLRVGWHF